MRSFFRDPVLPNVARIVPFVALGLAVGSVACSSNEVSGTNGAGGNLNTAAYAAGLCERQAKCESPLTYRPDWGDAAGCTTKTSPEIAKELNAPGVSVAQSQLDACTAKVKANDCNAGSTDFQECIFKGTRAAGQKCYASSQCATGSCFNTTTGPCGACTERVALGADCTNASCERGLVCLVTGGTATAPQATCAAFVPEGAACRGSAECEGANSYCVAGKCGRPLGAGATCAPPSDADPSPAPCDPLQSLICLPVDNTPTAAGKCKAVKFVNLGEKCGFDEATLELAFCAGASCSGIQTGTCVPDLKEGEACKTDQTASVVCEYPFSCTGGVCTRPPGAEACN